jgi:uncharacterized protein YegP (UPF0339 family)
LAHRRRSARDIIRGSIPTGALDRICSNPSSDSTFRSTASSPELERGGQDDPPRARQQPSETSADTFTWGHAVEFQLYMSGSQYRWRLLAENNENIASGESYHNKSDCLAAIDLVKGANNAPVKDQTRSAAPASQG